MKQELIQAVLLQAQNKKGTSLASCLLSLILTANKKGIHFTPDETDLLLNMIKEGKSEPEQKQIDAMIHFIQQYSKRKD